ncbi:MULTISPECIES: hypothetical protein [Streptomyces]|uniref:Uncharacterized protein n=2 Tax=Streptomyces TaxID=1883 RepID=A0ABV9IRS0_9ACTN
MESYAGSRKPKLSHEHRELGLFSYREIPGLVMPEAYKRTIEAWGLRGTGRPAGTGD